MNSLPQTKQIKLEHFNNLIAVALADGKLNEAEIEFFSDRAAELGIPGAEVQKIIDEADDLEFLVPMNGEDREEQLSDAVFIMMVDGEINDSEYDLCLKLGAKLEYTKKDVDHVINLVKKLWFYEEN